MFCARVVYWDRLGAVASREILVLGCNPMSDKNKFKRSLLTKWEAEIAVLFTTATMTDDLKTSE